MERRAFLQTTGTALAGSLLANNALAEALAPGKKKRVAMVGTGHRGGDVRRRQQICLMC